MRPLSAGSSHAPTFAEVTHPMLEILPLGAYICDVDGLITYFNQKAVELWGREPKLYDSTDRFCGSFKLFSVDGQPIDHSECWMALALKNKKEYLEESIIIERPDGERRTALAHATPIYSEKNELTGAVNILVDISEQVKMQQSLHDAIEMLKKADEKKNEFLATLGHELRNPLAAISSSVQVMELDINKATWALDVLSNNVTTISNLLDDLLDLTRISRGKISLKKESLKLNDLLVSVVEGFLPRTAEKSQQLEYNIPEQDLYVLGDPTRLEQVFVNLLVNASKFTPDHGKIEVNLQRAGKDAVVTIKDNGIGIPAEKLQIIFDPFEQVAFKNASTGLGIGLSLVKQFVEMHGGEVKATSPGLNKGSIFTVRLPRSGQLIPLPNAQEQQLPSIKPDLRILIVDDNEEAVYGLKSWLQKANCQIQSAAAGTVALQMLEEFAPQVFILDIGLPDMDGYELLKKLKDKCKNKATYIALTGFGHEGARQKSLEAGFDYHLNKPASFKTIFNILSTVS